MKTSGAKVSLTDSKKPLFVTKVREQLEESLRRAGCTGQITYLDPIKDPDNPQVYVILGATAK